MAENKDILLQAKDLVQWFPVKKKFFLDKQKYVKAVSGVSFEVRKGETLGVAGESGCGKSTLLRTILRLVEPTSGTIIYDGVDITKMKKKPLRKYREHMQIVFQDPFSALNPKMKVGSIIAEPLIINKMYKNPKDRWARVDELMNQVGLDPSYKNRYPHEFSGGQRQRIVIARALATKPQLLLCDEAVSALDVSVRAQVLNLLDDLQKELDLTYLFISHDLSVIEHICDRVAIMYLGKIVEIGTKDDIFNNPQHPYSKALLSAIPKVGQRDRSDRIIIQGDVPSPVNPPAGCHFHTRCPYATELCKTEPPVVDLGNGHLVACHICAGMEPGDAYAANAAENA